MNDFIEEEERVAHSLSAMWRHSEKVAICKLGKGHSSGTESVTSTLDFWPPEMWEIHCSWSNHSVLVSCNGNQSWLRTYSVLCSLWEDAQWAKQDREWSDGYKNHRCSLLTQVVKNLLAVQEIWVWSLRWEDPQEKRMATLSSILAWRIPRTEEPGRVQSLELQRVRHGWATNTFTFSLLLIKGHRLRLTRVRKPRERRLLRLLISQEVWQTGKCRESLQTDSSKWDTRNVNGYFEAISCSIEAK